MAFTPSSSPLQYQYKPLNLMAFAEPLAKMQEKYDLTKSAIEDSDVKATALQWAKDPEKAKALEQIYRNKRDELAQNLAETKNYTQAGSKIKKLQRLWNEDPERLALESNAKLWEERNKEELARVASGKLPKQQYLEWVADEKRKFESKEVGGTNFRRDDINPNGTYNPVTSKVGREEDRQKEMDELKYKVASDIKAKKWSGALQSLGIDPVIGDAQFKQSEFENLSSEEIDQKVESYIRGLDRFKPWLNEVADYNLKNYKYANDEGASYNALAQELVTKNYNANEAYIKSLEAAKKKGDKSYNEEDYKRAIRNKELLHEQMDNPDEGVVKNLFNKDYLNKQYDAKALGDIFEVNNSKTSYTFRDLPKEGSAGDGSITAADLAAGSVTPNKYLPIVGSLKQQQITAGKGLYSQLPLVNNIAGGIYRTINLGAPGSKNREFLEANPGAQRERQERIFLLANNSQNADEFYKKLIAHGFTSGTTKQNANTLFAALENKETKAYVASQLQNSQQNYNNYVGAKEQIQSLNETVLKDKEYKVDIAQLGEEKYSTSLETVAKLAKSWGKTLDQMISSGVVKEMQFEGEEGAYTEYYLSGNNLAQVNGYNSLDEAVKKGASINAFSPELGKEYQKVTSAASSRLNSGQVMSNTYIGDKKLDDAMTAMFTSVGSLEDFTPVETKNWDNTLGFDEEGNLAPGTSFDFANGQSVKLVKHGNNLYYQVPITVASEDGAIKRNILVKPKAGTEKTNEKFYQYILQNAKKNTDDPTADQTYDMAASGLYDIKNKSNLNNISAESFTVDYGDAPLVLETVPGSVSGVNIQIVKVASANGKPDQYKVQMVNAAGTKQFVYANDGTKEFSSSNVNAAKVRVSELLYQN